MISPTYLSGHKIVVLIIGSLISEISLGVGSSDGELTYSSSPFVFKISYDTLGAVVISSKEYSLSNRSLITSM